MGLLLALFAFVSQTLALPLHNMHPVDPTERAAVALHAIFGDRAVLCVQDEDGKGAPAPLDQSDCHCPLCQAGAGALATVLPTPAAQPERLAVLAGFLTPATPAPARTARWRVAAEPRGPPGEV